jgi:sterol desaturase/sphingolipid hydroxylase (fatty acid hydroxylase superfamily)
MTAHLITYADKVFHLAVWLVLLMVIFVPLERLFTLHPAKLWRAQTGVDLAWYFINSIVPAAIIAVPLAMLAQLLAKFNPLGLYAAVLTWPLWIKLLAAFVVNDIGAYWYHRLAHSNAWLWRFHAVHHSAEHVDWLTNTRDHPVDMVFTRMSGLIPVYLLGLGQATPGGMTDTAAIISVVGIFWSFMIHANVWFRFGPLEWLISTPAFHHWHHSNDEHRDRNFAAIFPVIDRVFGTLYLPRTYPTVYGIDAAMSPSLTGQLLDPLAGPLPVVKPA